MKKLLDESEKEQIKLLYESKGILLFEDNIFGTIARKALSWVGKNEDDFALLFKTSEKVLATSIDDIVEVASKSKSKTPLEDIQMKLMHIYNPSGAEQNIPKAKLQVANFLNGYAKSKGKLKWEEIKDEVVSGGGTSKTTQTASRAVQDYMKGQRVSNRWYIFTDPKYSTHINWSQITNAKNMDDYNKLIATAIKTKDFSKISRGGFEKFGVPNFREYLQNNIAKINELDPSTGRWSVVFK
jgi:hypothetical protein